jgi:hypothetical protein
MTAFKGLLTFILLCFAVVPAAFSQSGMTVVVDNIELAKMFADDQAIRHEISERGGWVKVKDDKAFLVRWKAEDAERLARAEASCSRGA